MNIPASIQRRYGAGPRHAYCYTYADPPSVGPQPPMQLELWVPGKRKGSGSWTPHADAPVGNYRAWRRVRRFHSHADKLSHSIARIRDVRDPLNTVERQCETYLQWARLKGLAAVSVFPGSYGQSAARPFGFTSRVVDPADYYGNAPAPELDEVTDVAA